MTTLSLTGQARSSITTGNNRFQVPAPVAIKYANVLALTGMAVILIRSLRGETSFDTAITEAACWMAIFGVVGCLIGAIAQATIEESVRLQMEKQLAQLDTNQQQ